MGPGVGPGVVQSWGEADHKGGWFNVGPGGSQTVLLTKQQKNKIIDLCTKQRLHTNFLFCDDVYEEQEVLAERKEVLSQSSVLASYAYIDLCTKQRLHTNLLSVSTSSCFAMMSLGNKSTVWLTPPPGPNHLGPIDISQSPQNIPHHRGEFCARMGQAKGAPPTPPPAPAPRTGYVAVAVALALLLVVWSLLQTEPDRTHVEPLVR